MAYLSNTDWSLAMAPYGVAHEQDDRRISRLAIVVITPDREEAFRCVSRG